MNLLFRFSDDLALIDPSALSRMFADPARIAAGVAFAEKLADKAAEPESMKRLREYLAPRVEVTSDGIGIVPIEGPMAYAPDPWDMIFNGIEDSRAVEKAIRSAAISPDVQAVMLRIHSPGGEVMGGADVAEAASWASSRKPVMAYTGGYMASLAYWIGSQASAGVYAANSAYVGSIGVITTLVDRTKYLENLGIKVEVITNKAARFKALGAPGTSLSEEGRTHLQDRAESLFRQFKAGILSKRPNVPDESMQGQVFIGKEAQKAGLVDAIGSFDFAMAALRNRMQRA